MTIKLPEAPPIAGLRFRQFDPARDYPALCDVINAIELETGNDAYLTPQLQVSWDEAEAQFDRSRDRFFAEVDGQPIGVGRVRAEKNLIGERVYQHSFMMLERWRGKGIGRATLHHNERRLREIAAAHDGEDCPRFFDTWSIPDKHNAAPLLTSAGYAPMRWFHSMTRPHLDDIPDVPLPPGIELRPIEEKHERAIWESNYEAFRDHWGFIETREPDKAFESWRNDPNLRKDLSRIAFDGDQPVGNVLIFIAPGQTRAWTESISVRRPWRRRGIARALIAQALHAIKAQGMKTASLGVDTGNPNSALKLYESMGYRTTKRNTAFRKPFVR
jgi:GNAT superfamily N-acetyltransferase